MSTPEKMFVTTDCVTFCYERETGVEVLLVKRANEPFKGQWALPGGFVDLDEDLVDAARRELMEETGIEPGVVVQCQTYGVPGRDPRGRNVTVAHLAVVGHGRQPATGADDAADARWFPLEDDLPELAFDHEQIVHDSVHFLAEVITRTHALYLLLPAQFDLDDMADLLNQITTYPWDVDDVMDLVTRSCVEIADPRSSPEESFFRCVVEDYKEPLGETTFISHMEDMAQALGYDNLEDALNDMEDFDFEDLDEF